MSKAAEVLDMLSGEEKMEMSENYAKVRHDDYDLLVHNDNFHKHVQKNPELQNQIAESGDPGETAYELAADHAIHRINEGGDVSNLGLDKTEPDSLEAILGR